MRGAARPAPSGRRRPPGPFLSRVSRCGGMAGPKGERHPPLRRPLAPGRRPEPPSSHPRRFPGERREGGGGSRFGAAVPAGVGRASRRGRSRTAASPPRAQRVSFAPAPTGPCGRAACAAGRAGTGRAPGGPAWSRAGWAAGTLRSSGRCRALARGSGCGADSPRQPCPEQVNCRRAGGALGPCAAPGISLLLGLQSCFHSRFQFVQVLKITT